MPRNIPATIVANNGKIEHIDNPRFPQFHFEWHPVEGKVYIGGVPGRWEDDVYIPGAVGHLDMKVLAEHCDTHARFIGFVQTYLRGYLQGEADMKMKLRTQRLKLVPNEQ